MKYLLILLLTTSMWAQDHHFIAARKEVTWTMTYQLPEGDIMKLLPKNNKKLIVNEGEFTGRGVKFNCTCKEGSWYFEQAFDLQFEITLVEGGYSVTVSDITFEGEGENNANNRLENYVLRIGQSVFHTTKKNITNLMCLDAYLENVFKVPGASVVK